MIKKLKDRLWNWMFGSYIEKIEETARKDSILSKIKSTDSPNNFGTVIDEFGLERVVGEKFSLTDTSESSYVVDPNTGSLITYSSVKEAMKKTGFLKKRKLSEDFTDDATQNEVMNEFIGFYGGSLVHKGNFEWDFQKQRLMFERSHEEGQKGIGKAIKDISTNFCLGSGFSFEYTDVDINDADVRKEITDTIWKVFNQTGLKTLQYTISDFIVDRGEIFIKVIRGNEKGHYAIECIDPWEISDYIWDEAQRKPIAWLRNDIRSDGYSVGTPILADGGKTSEGDPYVVRHWKFNVPDTIVRGRSDLYSVLYWLKIYQDFLKCRSRLNRFRSSVAWHKTIEGGERAISDGATKVQKPFPPGTVLVTDSKTKYEAIETNINAPDVKDDADSFKIMIASTIQIPHHWLFGSGENTNLATAKNMSAVPKRKFLRRQQDLYEIFQFVLWDGLRFHLDANYGKAINKNGDVVLPEQCTINELKESIANQPAPESTDVEQFEYNGMIIKKKHLDIIIPTLDEHNAEDILRLVTAAQRMRSSGIGSNHAIYEILGINYSRDQEIMEREITKGDYEAFKFVTSVFNTKLSAATAPTAQGGTIGEPGAEIGKPSPKTSADGLDANKDHVVDPSEEPKTKDDPYAGFGKTVDVSKGRRGGY